MLTSGEKASDIVREKLLASGGTAVIPLQRGEPCTIMLVDKERAITSDKLNGFRYGLSVFDVIAELLQHSPQGKARKGNSRGPEDKVGRGPLHGGHSRRCHCDSLLWQEVRRVLL